jgi:hypothetical protein
MTKQRPPPQPHQLARDDPGCRPRWENREWRLLHPWPANMRFEDGRTERVIDRAPLPFAAYPGYGNSALMAIESEFAENELGPQWLSKTVGGQRPRPLALLAYPRSFRLSANKIPATGAGSEDGLIRFRGFI